MNTNLILNLRDQANWHITTKDSDCMTPVHTGAHMLTKHKHTCVQIKAKVSSPSVCEGCSKP